MSIAWHPSRWWDWPVPVVGMSMDFFVSDD